MGHPRPGRQHHAGSAIARAIGLDHYTGRISNDIGYYLAGSKFRAICPGDAQLRTNTFLRQEKAGTRLQISFCAILQDELRKPLSYLLSAKHLVLDAESSGAIDRLIKKGRARTLNPAGGIEQYQAAILHQQLFSCSRFQRAPQHIGSQNQRNKLRSLPNRLPGNAGLPVAGTKFVRRVEAINAQHAGAAQRRLAQRRTAHRAQSNHNQVIVFH